MKIGILAGEASGDLLGARLIQALKARETPLRIDGIGGPAMIAAGCNSLVDIERLSLMGFIKPLLALPSLFQLRSRLYRHFLKTRPDVFIGVDAPDFNLGLELKLRRAGIPVVHYVSPSVWAWRQYRVKKIAKAVDLMLTLFPFETQFYEQHQVPVQYVGHPLADQISLEPDTLAARRSLCVDEQATYVALLPGSRQQELNYMAKPLLQAALRIWHEKPEVKFLTSQVNSHRYQQFYDFYKRYAPELPLHFFTRRTQDVMAAADVIAVTSGTATLEAMLCKKPMVIIYRMSPVTYQLAKRLVHVPFIGLPNLLAEEALVPELIQERAEPEIISDHILEYLEAPAKVQTLQARFTALHHLLKGDSAKAIADSVFSILK